MKNVGEFERELLICLDKIATALAYGSRLDPGMSPNSTELIAMAIGTDQNNLADAISNVSSSLGETSVSDALIEISEANCKIAESIQRLAIAVENHK